MFDFRPFRVLSSHRLTHRSSPPSSARPSTLRPRLLFAMARQFLIQSKLVEINSPIVYVYDNAILMQLGIIITLPGQCVAMHLDVPWFLGATRFNVPQWLLIAMEMSGMWAEHRVSQTQGVAYLHDWVKPQHDGGGLYLTFDWGSCLLMSILILHMHRLLLLSQRH